ncbi:MAG: hypothetical protein RIE52_08505 [Balneola sp.]
MSQSLYLDKERFALALDQSVSVIEDASAFSIGTSISLNKKADIAIQYSSITNRGSENQRSSNADGFSGYLTFWAKKTQEEFPLEVGLSILGSYADYDDFEISSFGIGVILAYKKEQPTGFEVVPLVGVSFVPFSQVSSNLYSRASNEQFFSFQFGVGLFTDIFNQSKFVLEPTMTFDTSANIGASLSTSIIF